DGDVRSVAWRHDEIGDHVLHRLSKRRYETVWLWPNGRHEFTFLRHLLANDRRAALQVLRGTLGAAPARPHRPAKVRNVHGRERRARSSDLLYLLRRLQRNPGGYLLRVYLMLRLIAGNRAYRRIIGRYVTSRRLRAATTADSLISDLARLHALRIGVEH